MENRFYCLGQIMQFFLYSIEKKLQICCLLQGLQEKQKIYILIVCWYFWNMGVFFFILIWVFANKKKDPIISDVVIFSIFCFGNRLRWSVKRKLFRNGKVMIDLR